MKVKSLKPKENTPKEKVAIFAHLKSFERVYSVSSIILSQCQMFSKNNYEVILFVAEDFNDPNFESSKVKIVPKLKVYSHKKNWKDDSEFSENTKEIDSFLEASIKDIKFCITHDTFYLPNYLPYNYSIRNYSVKNDKTLWLHWVHSSPALLNYNPMDPYNKTVSIKNEIQKKVFNLKFKNSKIVYLNKADKKVVKDFFSASEEEVICVYNPIDAYQFYGFSEETLSILKHTNIKEKDVVIIYPTRITLGKRHDVIISIVSYLKSKGLNVLAILMDNKII